MLSGFDSQAKLLSAGSGSWYNLLSDPEHNLNAG